MPTIPIRWADNTQQLKQNLREGLDVINATKASVDKLVQSFRGDALAASAHKWAAAISEIGGATKLSATEVDRANTIFQKFIDKQKALGQVIPQTIQNLAAETSARVAATKAAEEQAAAQAKLSGLVQAGLGAFGVGALTGVGAITTLATFGKQVLADADALTRLRDTTGISIDRLQILQSAAEDSGNSLDEVTSAITQLQNRLGSGDSAAIGALKALNLSFDDLKRLSPDQQFEEIGKALAGVEDPAKQIALAIDLFGRSGAQVLPTLKANFDALRESTTRMSADSVEAVDRIGDAWDRTTTNIKNWTAERVVNVFTVLSGRAGALADAMREIERVQSITGRIKRPDLFSGATAAAPGLPGDATLANITKDLNDQLQKNVEAHKKSEEAKKRDKEAAEKLHESLRRLEDIWPGLREQVGILDDTELKSIQIFLDHAAAADKLRQELNKLGDVRLGRVDTENLPGDTTNEIGNLQARFRAQDQAVKDAQEQFQKTQAVIGALASTVADFGSMFQGFVGQFLSGVSTAISAFGNLQQAIMQFGANSLNATFAAIQLGFAIGRLFAPVFRSIGRFFAGLFGGGGPGALTAAAQRAASGHAATGGLVTPFGIQHFAMGGLAMPAFGTDTVPAMLTPGEIILNRAQQATLASSGNVTVHIDARGAFGVDQFALRRWGRALAPMIAEAVAQNKNQSFSRFRASLGATS